MFTRRAALAAGAGLALAGSARAAEGIRPPSLDEFLRKPAVRGAAVSPDGKRLAVVGETWSGEKRSAYIDLIRTDDSQLVRTKIAVGDHDIEAMSWANDERLLLRTVRKMTDYERKQTNWVGDVDGARVRRLLSITAEGREPALMFANELALQRTNFNLAYVVHDLPDDPSHILMRAQEASRFNLYRLNVNTGAAELVERGGPNTNNWEIQNGRAVLRWEFFSQNGYGSILSRPEGATEWTTVRKVHRYELVRPDFDLLGDSGDPGVFLVAVREDDAATVAIRKWDVRTGAVGEVVAHRPNLDVEDALFDQDGKLVAARFIDDRASYDFFDKKLAPHVRGIESFFKRECNVTISDISQDHNRLLLEIDGPRLPKAHYFYDIEARRLENLGVARPWLSEERLAKVDLLDVRVRDGGTIRAYLTQPLAAGPRPLVVMPHGGPELRDSYGFDLYAQVFAAQGWLVLQPNFRGSSGYGRAFTDAGRRRWGDLMQEDIEDSVAQVLASGRADPKRVAIWGASYGGYAALMQAVRNPDLYRCAVSLAGPSDLMRFMDDRRPAGAADDPYYRYWVDLVGDPKADAVNLQRFSPARRAAEIKAPILLIHGLSDGNVLPNQSRIMADALRAARKPVEHVEVRGAGHSSWDDDDERLLLAKSVTFISTAIA